MKISKVYILILFSFFLVPKSVFAVSGTSDADDPVAREFKYIGRDIALAMKQGFLKNKLVNSARFMEAVEETQVSSEESLRLWKGEVNAYIEVDAINYYPNRAWIQISRSRWKNLKSQQRKYVLVYHEYLMILGLADQNYEISLQNYSSLPPVRFWVIPSF